MDSTITLYEEELLKLINEKFPGLELNTVYIREETEYKMAHVEFTKEERYY